MSIMEVMHPPGKFKNGGARPGAGRPKGSGNSRRVEIADELRRNNVTPLEVIIKAMLVHYNKKRWDQAAAFAKDAAPYMHPRLNSVEYKGTGAAAGNNRLEVVFVTKDANGAVSQQIGVAVTNGAGAPPPVPIEVLVAGDDE